MARFITSELTPGAPAAGVHVAKIIKAREKISEAGNTVLLMQAQFPQGEQLSFAITFVERAWKLIGHFCRSAELKLPQDTGIEVEIRPADVLGRYFYPLVELEGDGLEAVPKITRFLSRTEAIAANPEIARIQIQPQPPRALKAVSPQGGRL
jgi:hypothetical protein